MVKFELIMQAIKEHVEKCTPQHIQDLPYDGNANTEGKLNRRKDKIEEEIKLTEENISKLEKKVQKDEKELEKLKETQKENQKEFKKASEEFSNASDEYEEMIDEAIKDWKSSHNGFPAGFEENIAGGFPYGPYEKLDAIFSDLRDYIGDDPDKIWDLSKDVDKYSGYFIESSYDRDFDEIPYHRSEMELLSKDLEDTFKQYNTKETARDNMNSVMAKSDENLNEIEKVESRIKSNKKEIKQEKKKLKDYNDALGSAEDKLDKIED